MLVLNVTIVGKLNVLKHFFNMNVTDIAYCVC